MRSMERFAKRDCDMHAPKSRAPQSQPKWVAASLTLLNMLPQPTNTRQHAVSALRLHRIRETPTTCNAQLNTDSDCQTPLFKELEASTQRTFSFHVLLRFACEELDASKKRTVLPRMSSPFIVKATGTSSPRQVIVLVLRCNLLPHLSDKQDAHPRQEPPELVCSLRMRHPLSHPHHAQLVVSGLCLHNILDLGVLVLWVSGGRLCRGPAA